jgi:hypothetical protein
VDVATAELWFNSPSRKEGWLVPDSHDGSDRKAANETKKPYTAPTLTEYGSVSKLTMVKGSTVVEAGSPNKKQGCL